MSRSEHEHAGRDAAAHTGMETPACSGVPSAVADYQSTFREAPYYSTGRGWSDYAPAYVLGRTACSREPGTRFDAIEAELEAEWARVRGSSRLSWAEARGACKHAWRDCRAGEGAHVHEQAGATPDRHGG